jgi:lysophospholipase L1-like esterase
MGLNSPRLARLGRLHLALADGGACRPADDLGRPGITTVEAIKLLPQMTAANPQAVVVELGGHDYLKGHDRAATKANLQRILAAIRAAGAEPVLMEVPRGFISDPYAGLERELARGLDLELIFDTVIRRLVLRSPVAPPGSWTGGPYLSDDGLHPNANGARELARAVADALAGMYGPQILRGTSR